MRSRGGSTVLLYATAHAGMKRQILRVVTHGITPSSRCPETFVLDAHRRRRPVANVGIAGRFPRTVGSVFCFPAVRHFHRHLMTCRLSGPKSSDSPGHTNFREPDFIASKQVSHAGLVGSTALALTSNLTPTGPLIEALMANLPIRFLIGRVRRRV